MVLESQVDMPSWKMPKVNAVCRVECEGLNNDLVVIEDDFIVASVQSLLISLGRLLHRGWSLSPNNLASAKVNLVSPDGEAMVPLQFK